MNKTHQRRVGCHTKGYTLPYLMTMVSHVLESKSNHKPRDERHRHWTLNSGSVFPRSPQSSRSTRQHHYLTYLTFDYRSDVDSCTIPATTSLLIPAILSTRVQLRLSIVSQKTTRLVSLNSGGHHVLRTVDIMSVVIVRGQFATASGSTLEDTQKMFHIDSSSKFTIPI